MCDPGLARPIDIRDIDILIDIGRRGAVGDLLSIRRPRNWIRRPDLADVCDDDPIRPVGIYDLERPVYTHKGDLQAVWRPRHVRHSDASPLRILCESK